MVDDLRRSKIKKLASHCCEYCKSQDLYSPHDFTLDHIIPKSLGGTLKLSNLAYSCFLCNRLKSNKVSAFDSNIENWIPLFNPRKQYWGDHFIWDESALILIYCVQLGTLKEDAKVPALRGKIEEKVRWM